MVEMALETVESTESYTAELEKSVEEDDLTQVEFNTRTQDIYNEWDSALNVVWTALKHTLDSEKMQELTKEEKAWISEKEAADRKSVV